MSANALRLVRDSVRAAGQTGLVQVMSRHREGVLVALPEDNAADALVVFLEELAVAGVVVHTDPEISVPRVGMLGPDRWAVTVPQEAAWNMRNVLLDADGFATPTSRDGRAMWWVFPRSCVHVHRAREGALRRALDLISPQRLDEAGAPLPWVPATAPTTPLGGERCLDDDVELVAPGEPLAPLLLLADRPLDPDDEATIRNALRRVCATAGFGDVPLELVRVTTNRDGFVEGRVWMSPRGLEKLRLVVGPNADAAEIWATIVHEVAHGLAPGVGHGRAFKQAEVGLARAMFGAGWFQVPARKLSDAHAAVDWWIAVGIRAALHQGAAPVEAVGDEEQLAKVVGRIQKLRRLARSQLGTPEGRAACSKANDLLVRWDLGAYNVRLSEGIHDQMCDRWVVVGRRSVWRRQLAFHVAEYCGVFCLSRKSKGWMHFFGRYVDVVTAEWFYEVWEAHIMRSADVHIAAFKKRTQSERKAASTRTERVNFCDSAVLALSLKLQNLQRSHDAVAEGPEAIAVRRDLAEAFAGEQFRLRGRRWGSGTGKRVTMNAAGLVAGRNAPMGRGVGGPSGPKGLLSD